MACILSMLTRKVTNRGSLVSVANRLRIGQSGFDSWKGQVRDFFRSRIQNGSEAHPASYPMGSRGYLPGGKTAGT
jgi:hypothetical protein